jgi:hypothetical protein
MKQFYTIISDKKQSFEWKLKLKKLAVTWQTNTSYLLVEKEPGEFLKFNSCFTCIYVMFACSRVVNMDLVNDNLERIFTNFFIIFVYSSSSR